MFVRIVVAALFAGSPVLAQPAPPTGNPWAPPADQAQPPSQAPAQPAPPPPQAPPPAPPPQAPPQQQPAAQKLDSIVLKDHTKVEGHVREQVRGQYVVIEVVNGPIRTIAWDLIAEVNVWSLPPAGPAQPAAPITATPTAAQVPAAPPAQTLTTSTGHSLALGKKPKGKRVMRVITTTAGNLTREGASLSHTKICKTGDAQTCKETEELTIGSEGPKATYTSETDCSKTPGSDLCKETKQLGVSGAGFGASMTKEEVVAVDDNKRPTNATNMSMTANVGGGFGNPMGADIGIVFSSVDANLKFIAGQQFPKKLGGNWVGFALQPDVGFVFESIFITIPGFGSTSSQAYGFRVGSSAGVELVHFNKMDPKTLKQRGIGVMLGAFVGYMQTSTSDGMGGMTSSGDASIGPEIDLVLPNYNPATAKYKAQSINFMVLPTGDFVFITAGFSTSF